MNIHNVTATRALTVHVPTTIHLNFETGEDQGYAVQFTAGSE